jgi:hypothetical protein
MHTTSRRNQTSSQRFISRYWYLKNDQNTITTITNLYYIVLFYKISLFLLFASGVVWLCIAIAISYGEGISGSWLGELMMAVSVVKHSHVPQTRDQDGWTTAGYLS